MIRQTSHEPSEALMQQFLQISDRIHFPWRLYSDGAILVCRLFWWTPDLPVMPESVMEAVSQELLHPDTNLGMFARLQSCDRTELSDHLQLAKLDSASAMKLLADTCFRPLSFPGKPTMLMSRAVSLNPPDVELFRKSCVLLYISN